MSEIVNTPEGGDEGKNFGKQGNLFPSIANTQNTKPIFPTNHFERALLQQLLYGREINRRSFKPLSRKITDTDLSTCGRGLRRDGHIPIARQMKRVRTYTPDTKKKYTTRLACLFMTDEQIYQFEQAFPKWEESLNPEDKFPHWLGEQTNKYQRNLLEAEISENGATKRPYIRFFKHDKNFKLPDDYQLPWVRNPKKKP